MYFYIQFSPIFLSYFLERFHASPLCLSGKSKNVYKNEYSALVASTKVNLNYT
jgi:hypothetical protein